MPCAIAAGGALALLAAPGTAVAAPTTTIVSVASDGRVGTYGGSDGRVSGDGRLVVFSTRSSLAGGDKSRTDIYVRDRAAGTTTRASFQGTPTTRRNSFHPTISANGHYVVYDAIAYDSRGFGTYDVYRRDPRSKRTLLVSAAAAPLDSSQNTRPQVSGDGQLIAWRAFGVGLVVRDLRAGTIGRGDVSSSGRAGNGTDSTPSDVSTDGRYVVFNSTASNLVGHDSNDASDIFVRDLAAGTTSRVDTTPSGGQATGQFGGGSISADGRYVAFLARSQDLVPGRVSDDDAYVAVRDRRTGAVRVVSDPASGAAGTCSGTPQISDDGQHVAFVCQDGDLVPGDTNGTLDAFVRDLGSGAVVRLGRAGSAAGYRNVIDDPSLSADGTVATFASSDALVPSDTNGVADVYATAR